MPSNAAVQQQDAHRLEITTEALKRVLLPAIIVELQRVWSKALDLAYQEKASAAPVRVLGLIESDAEARAEHAGAIDRMRAALPIAFDAALPAALDVMDAMLEAQYLGLAIERRGPERGE